jgi:tRNA (guanine-N7-)-methyltransferase
MPDHREHQIMPPERWRDDKPRPPRAFFGRRKGHALKTRQAALFESLLPRVGLDLSKNPPSALGDLFATHVNHLRLEIGFGGAEHLVAQAQRHPHTGFIGTDAFANAVAKALVAIDELKLKNIRLYFGDASELIEWLPHGVVERIDLFYPDPWPKRRHWKRRFVQDESLKRLARVLKHGGELRFTTDIAGYAAYVLARIMTSSDFVWTAECADDWRQPWQGFAGTRYEAKAKREGRTSNYFIFRKIS